MGRSLFLLLLTFATISLSSTALVHAQSHSTAAPADEYFGPFKESILGIRNHINDLERKADDELAGAEQGMDNVEIAIEDWQKHYPHDSWIPGFLDRMVHVYGRAHMLDSAHCKKAYALLETMFPKSIQARDAADFVSANVVPQRRR